MAAAPTSYPGLNVEPGTIIAHRYEVCERVGSGGVGLVLRVLDRELNNEVVALKLLHPHLAQDEQVFQRFMNEVRVARALTHPNIVRIHDIGRAEEGFSYISMEFVDGVSLKEKIKRGPEDTTTGKITSFDEAISVFYQVLNGVAYAHQKGVVHRDLKPANVLFSNSGEIKLVDFGTARIHGMDTSLTQTGQVIGTPDYMSPEQIRGEKLDERCDIYALGIIAYELVTGERPFNADSSVAMAFKHLNEPVPSFANDKNGIPLWFQEIVHKAMAKDKAERYQSVPDLAGDLLDHTPELAQQSGFFSVEGTQFFGVPTAATGSGRHRSNGVNTPSKPKMSADESSADWDFTFDRGGSGPMKQFSIVAKRPANLTKLGFAGRILVFLLVAAGLFIGTTRGITGMNAWVGAQLNSIERSAGLDLTTVASVLGVKQPLQPDEIVAVDEAAREELARELLAADELLEEEPKTAEPAEVASQAAPDKAPAEQKTEKPAEVVQESAATVENTPGKDDEKLSVSSEATKETETNKEVAPKSSPSANELVAKESPATNTETPIEPVPTPKPLQLKAELVLQQGSRDIEGNIVSLDKLAASKWSASVNGFAETEQEKVKNIVADEMSLNVFDPRQAKVINKLTPAVKTYAAGSSKPAVIGGSFASLERLKLEPGPYRVDLIHNGEVIASRELTMYSARVTAAQPSATANGQRVTIVRMPSEGQVTETPGAEPVEASKEPALVVEPVIAQPPSTVPSTVPAYGREQEQVGTLRPTMPAPGGYQDSLSIAQPESGGLPPARRSGVEPALSNQPSVTPSPTAQREASFNRSTLDMTNTELERGPTMPVGEQPLVPTTKESYSGTLVLDDQRGTKETRALILNLEIREATITGSANLAGFGELRVNGKIHPRGIELILSGGEVLIRLSGGKHERVLRGRYQFDGGTYRGQWQASQVN